MSSIGDKIIVSSLIGEKVIIGGSIGSDLTPIGTLPRINLSSLTIAENAIIGSVVGVLSVSNGSGTYTFTITNDPDSKFTIDGSNLELGATLDYETATSHSVTISADNGVDTPITRTYTINVTDVVESLFDFANYSYWVNDFNFGNEYGTALSQTFAAGDVNTGANTIDLGVDLDLDAPSGNKNANGIEFTFSTTGTLPDGLLENTPYYMINTGNNYTIYRQSTQADVSILEGESDDLPIFPIQGFARQDTSFIVDLIDGGSGTHTVTSQPIQSSFTDAINSYNINATAGGNKNSYAEMGTDPSGERFIKGSPLTRQIDDSVYDVYGKQYTQDSDIASNLANQRTLIQTYVVRLDQFNNIGNRKANADSANVDIANNYIEFDTTNAIKNNGDLINFKEDEGSTLPTGITSGTDLYGRLVPSVNSKTITVHPTRTDAENDTNIIDITGSGSGEFTVTAPELVTDYERWGFFNSMAYNGYHNIMTDDRFQEQQGIYDLSSDVSDTGVFTNLSDADNGVVGEEIYIYVPPKAVRTRADSGKLVSGYYWVGDDDKIYETESDANTNTNPITFTGTGVGECKILNTSFVQLGTHVEQVQSRPPELQVQPYKRSLITYLIDKNDPAESFQVYYVWIDGVSKGKFVTNRSKQNFAATDTLAGLGSFLNSPEGHVPLVGDIYHHGFGTDTGAIPTGDITEINTGLIAEYNTGVMINKKPEIFNEPKAFFDGGDVAENDVIQLSSGFVTGYPKPTITWQKYYGAVAQGSAFSGDSYTVTAADATEGTISFKQIATNSEGSHTRDVLDDITVTGANPAWVSYPEFEGRMKPDATKLTLEDTDKVASFEEFYNGTAARTLTATGTARPTYDSGTGKITFDGASNALSNTNPFLYAAGSMTLVIVLDNIAAALSDTFISETDDGTGNAFYSPLQFDSSERPEVQVRNDAGTFTPNTDAHDTNSLTGKNLLVLEDTGTEFNIWINGVLGNSSPSTYTRSGTLTLLNFVLGGRLQNNGSDRTVGFDFYDMVMFSGTLSVAEKNAVQDDLASDHSVTVTTIT